MMITLTSLGMPSQNAAHVVVGCKPRRNALAHNIREMRGVEDGKIRFLRDKQVAFVVTLPAFKRHRVAAPARECVRPLGDEL